MQRVPKSRFALCYMRHDMTFLTFQCGGRWRRPLWLSSSAMSSFPTPTPSRTVDFVVVEEGLSSVSPSSSSTSSSSSGLANSGLGLQQRYFNIPNVTNQQPKYFSTYYVRTFNFNGRRIKILKFVTSATLERNI